MRSLPNFLLVETVGARLVQYDQSRAVVAELCSEQILLLRRALAVHIYPAIHVCACSQEGRAALVARGEFRLGRRGKPFEKNARGQHGHNDKHHSHVRPRAQSRLEPGG